MICIFCGRAWPVWLSPCKHIHVFVCLSCVCLLEMTPGRLAKKWSSAGLQTNQSCQAEMTDCFMTLITSSFPLSSLHVCVSVYRLFPHLESQLFSFGPIPMLWEFPSLFLQTPLLLPKPRFPVTSRQKPGLPCLAARELASNLLFLWGPAGVCRLNPSWILMDGSLTSWLKME